MATEHSLITQTVEKLASGAGQLALRSVDAEETVRYVIGPLGTPLTTANLPLPHTKRWVIRRKAEVVAAVRGGLLSLEEACSRYGLSSDEVVSWQRLIDRFGLRGLRLPEGGGRLWLRAGGGVGGGVASVDFWEEDPQGFGVSEARTLTIAASILGLELARRQAKPVGSP
jgi:hypothetical protein